ncbi:hypothetical protein LCGC14_1841650, partial [marine sediment metagenome]
MANPRITSNRIDLLSGNDTDNTARITAQRLDILYVDLPPIAAAAAAVVTPDLDPVGTKLDLFYWHLRGFDRRGAGIAYTQDANDSSVYKVSGVFRDQADFAILQWDADDIYGHLAWKYLPDFDFSKLSWTFDLRYDNFQSISSPKFETVPWGSLSYILEDGTTGTLDLFAHAVRRVSNLDSYTPAHGIFQFEDNGIQLFDLVTLWYGNLKFEVIIISPLIQDLTNVIEDIRDQINNTNWDGNVAELALWATKEGTTLRIEAAVYGTCNAFGNVLVRTSGHTFAGLSVGSQIRIDGTLTTVIGILSPGFITVATSFGGQDVYTWVAPTGGVDGNHIEMYTQSKTSTLRLTKETVKFQGGTEDVTWKITIPLSLIGSGNIRKLWFTVAPALPDGQIFSDVVGSLTISNSAVTSILGTTKALRIAGPHSVLVNHDSTNCFFEGFWGETYGNFNQGIAKNSTVAGSRVIITYTCSFIHDLYLGTQLAPDKGVFSVTLDGDTPDFLDMYLDVEPPVNTRRVLRSAVPAGEHSLDLILLSPNPSTPERLIGLVDYVQAVVYSNDWPSPLNDRSDVGLASSYDTDHWYKLLPQRAVKNIVQTGLTGQVNHFVGVFFALTRLRRGGFFSTLVLTFINFEVGDEIFINIGGTTIGKTVFTADTGASIANHFKMFINHTFVGVWASSSGSTLFIQIRSPINGFTHNVSWTSSTGIAIETGTLAAGTEGEWEIHPSPTKVLNEGSVEWHRDYFKQLKAEGLDVIATYSHEWVVPPDDLSAGNIWIARFADGTAVSTETEFGDLS